VTSESANTAGQSIGLKGRLPLAKRDDSRIASITADIQPAMSVVAVTGPEQVRGS